MQSISLFGAALLALSSIVCAAPAVTGTFSRASSSTAAGAICTKSPYSSYLPLSTYYLATEYCTSAYPLPCTSTGPVKTVTSTRTNPTTSTVIIEASPIRKTVTSGSTTITTTIRTTLTPSRITRTKTVTNLIALGVNSLVDVNLKPRSPTTMTSAPSKPSNEAQMSSLMDGVSWFAGRDSSFYKTLCSCLETTPACAAKTATLTVTKGVTALVTKSHTSTTATVTVRSSARVTRRSTVTAATPVTTKTVTKNVLVSATVNAPVVSAVLKPIVSLVGGLLG